MSVSDIHKMLLSFLQQLMVVTLNGLRGELAQNHAEEALNYVNGHVLTRNH